MENSKLFELLKTFSAKEMRLFGQFLASPYHNKNETVCKLFKVISTAHPFSAEKPLTKETVFKKMFGKEKFDDVKIRGIISDTLELAEQFLSFENMKKQNFSASSFLLDELNDRHLDVLYELRFNRQLEKNKKSTRHNRWFFLDNFLINASHINYMRRTSDGKDEKMIGVNALENSLAALRDFFVYEGMQISVAMTILQSIVNYSATMTGMTDKIEKMINEIPEPSPVIEMMKLFRKVAPKNNADAYQMLKNSLINDRPPFLSDEDLRTGFELIYNYLAYQVHIGKPTTSDSLLIAKRYRELGLHIENGLIEATYFMNTVMDALHAKEFDWAEKFIYENEKYLPAEHKQNHINFTMGVLHEQKQNYREALKHISKVKSTSVLVNLNVYSLFIKIYFARNEMKQVLNSADNFINFLKANKKIPKHKKDACINLCRFISQLAKIKLGKFKTEENVFLDELENCEPVALKAWITTQAKNVFAVSSMTDRK